MSDEQPEERAGDAGAHGGLCDVAGVGVQHAGDDVGPADDAGAEREGRHGGQQDRDDARRHAQHAPTAQGRRAHPEGCTRRPCRGGERHPTWAAAAWNRSLSRNFNSST